MDCHQTIYWTHHRIPLHHLSSEKPVNNCKDYDLSDSLPDVGTQALMCMDFIVLAIWIITKHLAAFKPFSAEVVHHIPYQYSDHMLKPSTSVSWNRQHIPIKFLQSPNEKKYLISCVSFSSLLIFSLSLSLISASNGTAFEEWEKLQEIWFTFCSTHRKSMLLNMGNHVVNIAWDLKPSVYYSALAFYNLLGIGMPNSSDRFTPILVGGDRLTMANRQK